MNKLLASCILICLSLSPLFSQEKTGKNFMPEGDKPAFVALVFLGTECPISQDYVGVLNRISDRYGQGIIQGIIPGKFTGKQVKDFSKTYQVRFALDRDQDLKLTKRYNITVTPEVVLLDTASQIRYRGAVDNWYFELGQHRQVITEHFLLNAINSLLNGQEVTVKETEPVGCPIPGQK